MNSMKVGIIGAGAVGQALTHALVQAGNSVVGISSRSIDRAEALSARVPDSVAYSDPQHVVDLADLVFLTVPDDAIETLCDDLQWRPGMAVVHCSGALTRSALSSAARAGAAVGSCHPMQTFTAVTTADDHLSGCYFGIEADEPLRSTLRDLAHRIGGRPLFLESESKPLYHAAAVIASNYMVTLISVATDLLGDLGLESGEARDALLPLLHGTLANVEKQGPPGALAGPVARGDFATVRIHLRELQTRRPDLLALYIEVGRRTVPLARLKGTLSSDGASALLELFDEYTPAARTSTD